MNKTRRVEAALRLLFDGALAMLAANEAVKPSTTMQPAAKARGARSVLLQSRATLDRRNDLPCLQSVCTYVRRLDLLRRLHCIQTCNSKWAACTSRHAAIASEMANGSASKICDVGASESC